MSGDKPILTEYDVEQIENFFSYFNDPAKNDLVMSPSLIREIAIFRDKSKKEAYTLDDQERFKTAICTSIKNNAGHPLFSDPDIAHIIDRFIVRSEDEVFDEEMGKLLTPQE